MAPDQTEQKGREKGRERGGRGGAGILDLGATEMYTYHDLRMDEVLRPGHDGGQDGLEAHC